MFAWLTEDTLASVARRKALMAYLFLLPTIFGILIFTAGPIVASLGLSFYQWNVFQPPVFIGVSNYERLMKDTRVMVSFKNTIHFVLLAVFLQISVSLLLALGMQRLRCGISILYADSLFHAFSHVWCSYRDCIRLHASQ